MKEARGFGDLSENFEYKAAKQEKNRNESRIRFLENMIKTARVIRDTSGEGTVGLYDRVTVYLEEDDETEVEMATDVMFEFAEDGVETHEFNDGVSDNVPMLGDIIISMPRAKLQSEEYGHSLEREVCFLTVHGVLHLLGYDHMTDEETREMRNLEDKVLSELGISR